METQRVYVTGMPTALWRRVKATAASRGQTIAELLVEVLSAHLAAGEER